MAYIIRTYDSFGNLCYQSKKHKTPEAAMQSNLYADLNFLETDGRLEALEIYKDYVKLHVVEQL